MSGKTFLLIIIALLMTAAGGGVFYLYLTYDDKNESNTESESTLEDEDIADNGEAIKPPQVLTGITFSFPEEEIAMDLSETREIQIRFDNLQGQDIRTIELDLMYDPNTIEVTEIKGNPHAEGFDIYIGQNIDSGAGTVSISASASAGRSVNRSLTFATISVKKISEGTSSIAILPTKDENQPYTQFIASDGEIYSIADGAALVIK